MNNEERMAAQLADLRIQDINRQMDAITKLARAYADATPEQRANVNTSEIQAQIEKYENLKAERANLYAEQEVRAQKELEAQRAAEQVAAQRAAQGTGRRVVRRNNDVPTGTPTSDPTGTLTDEQYAEWLAELEREAYLQNPHPIFNNGDGTYDYSDGTKRYADGTIIKGESNNIEVRVSPSGAPYYYDKTTGNQVAPIGTDKYGNPLVADSKGGVRTMYPIDNAIYNTMVANQLASAAARDEDAAIKYANDVRDDTVVNLALAPTYLAGGVGVNGIRTAGVGSNALGRAYNTANNVLKYNRAINRANAIGNIGRANVVPASRAMNVVSEGNIVNPTYGNSLSNWAQRYINTANKLANEQTVNNGVQYLNGLFNKYTPFSL